MLRKINVFSRNLFELFLSLLCAVLLVFAFPAFQLSALAWLAFIPLFIILDNSSPKRSFFLSYLAGLFFFGSILYWLTYVTIPGYLVLIFSLALFFGLFGLFGNICINKVRASKFTILSCLILPALWVSLEFIRGVLFTGFPWCILGYTQYKIPIIIQISDITGSYGVSFVIIMVNFVFYVYLSDLFKRISGNAIRKHSRPLKFPAVVSITMLISLALYGYFALKNDDYNTGLKLSVVQGNIEQSKKWDPLYKDYILDRYETLTKEAAKDRGDLIVWPETAVPGYLDEEEIDLWLKNIIKDKGIPLFLGTVTYVTNKGENHFFNSAVLFSADGNIKKMYSKLHLVPFGEYVPFERFFPQFRNLIDVEIGNFTSGDEFTLFDITTENNKIYRYGALICFEDIFPAMARKFVLKGANFLINITNDAWFKESSEQLQHVQASVFRAVENRISILRAANTGFSCYINPRGIIEDSIHDTQTGSMYIPAFKTFEVKISKKSSFYTKYGDIFAYICILLVIIYYLVDFLKSKLYHN